MARDHRAVKREASNKASMRPDFRGAFLISFLLSPYLFSPPSLSLFSSLIPAPAANSRRSSEPQKTHNHGIISGVWAGHLSCRSHRKTASMVPPKELRCSLGSSSIGLCTIDRGGLRARAHE